MSEKTKDDLINKPMKKRSTNEYKIELEQRIKKYKSSLDEICAAILVIDKATSGKKIHSKIEKLQGEYESQKKQTVQESTKVEENVQLTDESKVSTEAKKRKDIAYKIGRKTIDFGVIVSRLGEDDEVLATQEKVISRYENSKKGILAYIRKISINAIKKVDDLMM